MQYAVAQTRLGQFALHRATNVAWFQLTGLYDLTSIKPDLKHAPLIYSKPHMGIKSRVQKLKLSRDRGREKTAVSFYVKIQKHLTDFFFFQI